MTNPRKKLLFVAALLAACPPLAHLLARRSAPGARAGGGPPRITVAPASAPLSRAWEVPVRSFRPGESFTYQISDVRTARIDSDEGQRQEDRAELQGALTLTVARAEGADVLLRGDFVATRYVRGAGGAPGERPRLDSTFYVTSRRSGEALGFHFPRGLHGEAPTPLRGIVQALQLVLPPAGQGSWRATEQDSSGEYLAVYALAAEGLRKEKERYLRIRGPVGLAPISQAGRPLPRGATTYTLDPSGWPATARAEETVRIAALGAQILGETRFSATLSGRAFHPERIGGVPTGYESDEELAAAALGRAAAEADRALLGGRTLGELRRDLMDATKTARSQAQGRVAALLRLDPKAAREVGREVRRGGADEDARRRLVAALGSAGTKEALSELVSLLGERETGALRTQVAASLALSRHPTPEVAEELGRAMESKDPAVSEAAAMVAGSVVHTLNEEEADDTSDTVQSLMDKLGKAADHHQRTVYLQALGNTGDPRAVPAIAPYLRHQSDTLRALAVFCLRLMPGELVDAAIVSAMADSAALVRRSAVSTIPHRPVEPLLGELETFLRREPSEGIRMTLLNGLQVKRQEAAAATEIIHWAADNDPSAKVRALATELLTEQA